MCEVNHKSKLVTLLEEALKRAKELPRQSMEPEAMGVVGALIGACMDAHGEWLEHEYFKAARDAE